MRRDPRPFWLHQLHERLERAQAHRLVVPRFDALGAHWRFTNPTRIVIFGRGIRAGRALHACAADDRYVRLTSWGETAEIILGDAVLISPGARITADARVSVGDGTMLASDVLVTDSDWHGLYDRVGRPPGAPVTIGANVWVGDGAYIGKGVTVGDHAVIGARAVVTKDVEPFAVVAGAPARVVKRLDPDAPRRTRMELLADPQALAAQDRALMRSFLRGRTTPGWLKARFMPGRED